MSQVFFISDTHFFHHNILKFEEEQRPFSSIEQHNEFLVDRWNSVVKKKKDVVWHLGDVCFGSPENMSIMNRLTGRKYLILGNHDRFDLGVYMKYFRGVFAMQKKYGFLLSHVPVHPNQLTRWPVNVHGHMHSERCRCNTPHNVEVDDPRYINVSVEQNALFPFTLEELRSRVGY